MLAGPSLVTAARAAVLLADDPELAAALADGSTGFAVLDGSARRRSTPRPPTTSWRSTAAPWSSAPARRPSGAPIDATRGLATVRLTDRRVLPEDAGELWARARRVGAVVLAAEGLGAADRAVQLGVAYAKERQAFGRADRLVPGGQARCWSTPGSGSSSCARWSGGRPGPPTTRRTSCPLAASAAKAYAARVFEQAAETLIQVHGGIGFTWEHDAHLYWRRAKVDRLLLGDEAEHLDAVARLASPAPSGRPPSARPRT